MEGVARLGGVADLDFTGGPTIVMLNGMGGSPMIGIVVVSHAARPIGVSPGRAAGPIVRMPEPLGEPRATSPLRQPDRAAAAGRIAEATASVERALRQRASIVTGAARDILEATAMMAADPSLRDDATRLVLEDGESPERAVWVTIGAIAENFAAQGGRMADRVSDLHDLRNRMVAEILGRQTPGVPVRSEPYVLVARDLAPADTALLDPAVCRAIVTAEGGPTSHTAILARSLGLPAIVAAPAALGLPEGTIVIVDGATGVIIVDPSEEQLAAVAAESREAVRYEGGAQTSDGHRVELLANVGSPETVSDAVEANADGIGLFRTEFCFLGRTAAPSIAEQVAAYRPVFAAFPGKKVIVRSLDAGSDKPLAFVTTSGEENPALGIRGYRTSWRRPEVLDDQLTAIAEAAAAENAKVGVMAPMISTAEEAHEFAALCAKHGITSVGAMIETPAAAITAADVLSPLDFGSLGTNDLTQYTMAADRLVGDLATLNDPWQPAVLRMIQAACIGGTDAGRPVGVCGEAAAEPLLAAALVGLGVTSLSMSPRSLGAVAELLGTVTVAQCRAAALAAVAAATPAAARAAAAALLTAEA